MRKMTPSQWRRCLEQNGLRNEFSHLYPGSNREQTGRYSALLRSFSARFGEKEVSLFSAPGRTELCGNHTDHQHGRVLAAAVNRDIIAAAAPRTDGRAVLLSQGFGETAIEVFNHAVHPEEAGTAGALLRGMAAGYAQNGYAIGGFEAVVSSGVPAGSGLSSSAALEVLIGALFNCLYNRGEIAPLETAKLAQRAENIYFGKPCGLMDPCACALGGAVAMDFANPAEPEIQAIPCDFAGMGYALFVVNAGGSHAGLTGEYAAIPLEMRSVAAQFGKDFLAQVDELAFWAALPGLRGKVPDRALLRAMHFFDETRRVGRAADALAKGDGPAYRTVMAESGRSSAELLQNIYPCDCGGERSVALALALSAGLLGDCGGAWRVHGGGFAGTVQALVPLGERERYQKEMDAAFGEGASMELRVRPAGGWVM